MTLAISKNVSLKPFNTLSLDVSAEYLLTIDDLALLEQALAWANDKKITITVIGGGSNLILANDIKGLVLLIRTKGIQIVAKQATSVIVEVAAGVVWQDLVEWSVNQGWGGIENLSLIYGTVGAAPVQNIGAYGVEFKDVCHEVDAVNRQTGKLHTFTSLDCQFSYRDSIFKQQAEQWIITKVRIRLDSKAPINIGYEALQQNLPAQTATLTYAQVSQLVIKTRQQRLPDPDELANVGSFFKNPIVSLQKAKQLKEQYPDLVIYPYQDQQVKLAAGWLIDRAGWKGYRQGDVGTYPKQALVLVNYAQAAATDVLSFAEQIQGDIQQKFGISLEYEPVIYR